MFLALVGYNPALPRVNLQELGEWMDAYVSEIVAVIDQKHAEDLDKIVAQLKAAGVDVSNINKDENVIEGCVESEKLKEVGKVDGVEYVRTVFTYAANYPPGDPRDRDGA